MTDYALGELVGRGVGLLILIAVLVRVLQAVHAQVRKKGTAHQNEAGRR